MSETPTEKKYYDSKGVEVPLCTRRLCDDPNCNDVFDDDENIFCGHGWEVCELCGTDHRTTNVIKNWNGADIDYIADWGYKRADAEMKVMMQWHVQEGGGRNFVIGTSHSHMLRERLQNSQEIQAMLPKWPPPMKPGTEMRVKNLVKKEELNGKRGVVTRWVKKKQKYAVRIEGYMNNQEFLVDECHIQVIRM